MVAVNAGHRRPVVGGRPAAGSTSCGAGGATGDERGRRAPGSPTPSCSAPTWPPLAPGLAQAARTVGSPQIRNAGTIGGNLGTASPAGDTLPVLVALDATVELVGADGAAIACRSPSSSSARSAPRSAPAS